MVTIKKEAINSPYHTSSNMEQKLTPGLLAAHIFAIWVVVIVVAAAWGFENASDALAFYGVYHRDPWNQLIHFFGVPGIIWSMIVFMVHIQVPIFGNKVYPLNYGMVLSIFYVIFYLQIDPLGGILYAPVLYAMYYSAVVLRRDDQEKAGGEASSSWNGTGRLLSYALVVHVLSWYMQIHWGHSVFEGARPAIFQSLGGALTAAPLFAFYEGLWLIGINKELQQATLQLVEKYTQELCASGEVAMRACEGLTNSILGWD